MPDDNEHDALFAEISVAHQEALQRGLVFVCFLLEMALIEASQIAKGQSMTASLPPDQQAYLEFMLDVAGDSPELRKSLEAIARSQTGFDNPIAVAAPDGRLDQSVALPLDRRTMPSGWPE